VTVAGEKSMGHRTWARRFRGNVCCLRRFQPYQVQIPSRSLTGRCNLGVSRRECCFLLASWRFAQRACELTQVLPTDALTGAPWHAGIPL
jgi:hypothetical protein